MRKNTLLIISLVTAITLAFSGCSNKGRNYKSIKLEPALTTQEVLDFYVKELSYESITQYSNLNTEVLEYNEVDGEMKEKAIKSYKEVIKDYKSTSNYRISKYNHEYLKSFLDDLIINEKEIVGVKEALGYYYVEVIYDTVENKTGVVKDEANYVGINGIIVEDYEGNVTIDKDYLELAIGEINRSRKLNNQDLIEGGLDIGVGGNTVVRSGIDDVDTESIEQGTENIDAESISQGTENIDTESIGQITENKDTDIIDEIVLKEMDNSTKSIIDGLSYSADKVMQLDYNVIEFNTVVGSSKEQIAFMPDIGLVYTAALESGSVNGYGLFDAGNYGLKDFGYNRSNTNGELNITFVFKQNELQGKDLDYQFLYVNSYKNNNGLGDIVEITVPGFIRTEIEKVVERLDRATNNRDVTALLGRGIVEDARLGMLYGMYGVNSQIVSLVSNVKRVIERDNNTYLIELERTIEDCAKGTGVTAVYEDVYYMVVRQKELKFTINDILLVSRELKRVPEPDPDSASYRRLVALNLAGPVSEENKIGIRSTLKNLYGASTDRKINGMYESFNTDTELLSEERLEYLNSRLRGYLVNMGVSQPAVMNGRVTTWIGGYDTQAEVMTEELIEYVGMDAGLVIECYYLLSNYGTQWVIDDIQVTGEREVSGNDLAEIRDRIVH